MPPFDPNDPGLLTPEVARRSEASEEDLVIAFIRYAQHEWQCKSRDDDHCPHSLSDDRVVCADYPCTCGLAEILHGLMPTVVFQLQPHSFETPTS